MKVNCKSDKKQFDTKKEAIEFINKIREGNEPKLKYYKCKWCKKYHLTHKTKEQVKSKRQFISREAAYWAKKLNVELD